MNEKLYIYEALELRSEYDARIKTLRDCLPEARANRGRFSLSSADEVRRRPSKDFDLSNARQQLRKLEFKRRKLNSAVQRANFSNNIEFKGESMALHEALETRKALQVQIGELHTQVVESAYVRVIYKEGRDIVEEPEISYQESMLQLDEARLAFRELNRKLRKATFEIIIEYHEE